MESRLLDRLSNSGDTDNLFASLNILSHQSLTYTLLDKIIDLIMDETLPPGYAFPNENVMCKELGIGRSTLRETYSALSAMGFITRSKTGTTVNDRNRIVTSMPLRYIFKNSELNDAMDFRIMLESHAADLAGQKADETAISEMQYLIDEMQRTTDVAKLSNLDFNFHLSIATASKNVLLRNTLIAIAGEMERSTYSGYMLGENVVENSIAFHLSILDAIKQHDGTLAKHRMRTHIRDIYTVLLRLSYNSGPDSK